MDHKYFITFLLSISSLVGSCQKFPYQTDSVFFKVFNKEIQIQSHRYGTPKLYFLSLHDNEDTGVKAAFEFMRLHGAAITELKYGGIRNISFNIDTNYYEVDPNRIFSVRGIYAFYQDEEPVFRISAFADTLLQVYNYKKHGYIITLHNNTDSLFTIHSYLPGNEREKDAGQIFINPEMDMDDFLFVTEPFFFEYLKKQNVNVVLQNDRVPDDGSLSVYAAANDIPYINIEVQHQHEKEHRRLINVVYGMMQEWEKQRIGSRQAVSNN